jgi:hypothetical protein
MGQEQHSMDELFRVILKDQETPPPADSWNNIEKALDSKKRVRVIWTMRALAAVVTLLVTFASGYFIANYKNHSDISTNKQSIQAQSSSIQSQPAANQVILNNITTKQENTSISGIENRETKQVSPSETVMAIRDKSAYQPVSNNSTVSEDSRLAYLLPIQYFLPVRDINHPGISALEFQTNRADEIASEEIVLTDKNSSDESTKSSSHWSLGGQISPLYAYRETSASNMNTAAANQYATNSSQQESGIISYSGGMNVEYRASKRLSVSSGLYYSRMGQNIKGNEAFLSYEGFHLQSPSLATDNTAGQNSTGILYKSNSNISPVTNPLISSGQSASLLQTMDFLELPVMLRYKIIDRKVGFHILGGLSTNILVANKLVLEDASGKQDYGKTDGLSTFNYSSTLGLGVDYAISSRIQLNLEPAFKYYINSINSSGNIDSHPYSFGIYTGMRYTF